MLMKTVMDIVLLLGWEGFINTRGIGKTEGKQEAENDKWNLKTAGPKVMIQKLFHGG